MIRAALLSVMLFPGSVAMAQWEGHELAPRDTSLIPYHGEFDFREGIYTGFEEFRANRPGVPANGILDEEGAPVNDPRQVVGRIFRTDSAGQRQPIDMDSIWGYCVRDVVHVRIGDGFSPVRLMGSIAHLVYERTYRSAGYADPMYGMGTTTYTTLEQRLLDMETGDLLPVDDAGIRALIQRDSWLVAEFDALPKKERRKEETVFRFMRRYNELHPLMFPK